MNEWELSPSNGGSTLRSSRLLGLALVMAVIASRPVLGQGAPSPRPGHRPSGPRTELRFAPEIGTNVDYKVAASFDLDVLFSGDQHIDGDGLVHLKAESVDEDGNILMRVDFESFRIRMGKDTWDPKAEEVGFGFRATPLRDVVALDRKADSLAALLVRAMYSIIFPERRIRIGREWTHALPAFETPSEVRPAHPDDQPSHVWQTIPEELRRQKPTAKHTLVALSDIDGDRAAGIISEFTLNFDLASYGIGTTGKLELDMTSEILESNGHLRCALATGRGKLHTMGVLSVPVRNFKLTARLIDPTTGQPVEFLHQYELPAPPGEGSPSGASVPR